MERVKSTNYKYNVFDIFLMSIAIGFTNSLNVLIFFEVEELAITALSISFLHNWYIWVGRLIGCGIVILFYRTRHQNKLILANSFITIPCVALFWTMVDTAYSKDYVVELISAAILLTLGIIYQSLFQIL